ncbi:MAG: serine/threonine-protein kinase [Polyangiaceae bacterium]
MKSRLRPGTATTPRDQLPKASRYELLVKIASGGMGVVYIGRLRGSSKLLAIKRAHPHLLRDPALRQMLQTEATLASSMNHPNVVGVEGVEELPNELLLAMEYVEGAALSDLIAESESLGKRLETAVIVKIILDACAGLQAVHELTDETLSPLNLVHRDVSPQNILVGLDGVARISDFGIAKGDTDDGGSLEGKMGYMAPEYLESKILDARGDIFALGVVAWEALTNQRLFARSNEFETLKRLKEKEVLPPSSVAPELDDRFDNVISTALERDPNRRFQSARAFAEALEATAAEAKLVLSKATVSARTHALVDAILERRRELVRGRIAELEVPGPALTPAPSFASPVLPPMPESAPPPSGVRASLRRRLVIGFVLVILAIAAVVFALRPTALPVTTVTAASTEPSASSTASNAPPTEPPPVADGTTPSATASTSSSAKSPEKPPRSPGKPRTPNRPSSHP